MKLSIVIPVYNERTTVLQVLDRVRALPLSVELEVVVVDDGSTDGTREILGGLEGDPRLVVHLADRNRGKGAAVRAGIERATGDWVIIQDADLELDPGEIPALLQPLLEGRAEVVYGSRFLGRPPTWGSLNYWANRLLTAATNLLFRGSLTDMETCYKVLPTALLRALELEACGFDIEPEITARTLRRGVRIQELPIRYAPRSRAAGKKMRWRDGADALAMLLRVRLGRD